MFTLARCACILTLLCGSPALAEPPAQAGAPKSADPAALVEQLRKGGLVLYARHALTQHDATEDGPIDFKDCSKQRNLSEQGRVQAREIGQRMRTLGVPVGEVLSSPYCRCIDTARLAFGGEPEVSQLLHFAVNANEQERAQQSTRLRELLSTPPGAKNRVLVSHTANLKEATGIWPKKEGEIHVFLPHGSGRFDHLGVIEPEQWSALTAPASPAR